MIISKLFQKWHNLLLTCPPVWIFPEHFHSDRASKTDLSSTSPQSTIETLSHSMVPLWLEKFVYLVEGGASLVGPVSSCEIDTHIQSWMLMFTKDIASIIELHMHSACSTDMSWTDAIILCEVGAAVDVLGKGFALASLHPNFTLFTEHHRNALRYGVAEIKEKLFGCSNPLVGEGGYAASESDLPDLVFSKFGGEIWRKKLLPSELESKIKFLTHMKFPSAPRACTPHLRWRGEVDLAEYIVDRQSEELLMIELIWEVCKRKRI